MNDDYDFDPQVQNCLTCHVEIDDENGGTYPDILRRISHTLREVAAQLETKDLESGFHPILRPNGEKIGQIYLDHYGKGEC